MTGVKKIVCLMVFVFAVLPMMAQKPKIADVFKLMPDSLMPYLSKNNRLDMIDFMEAKMKAEVTNMLEGTTVMTALTEDSLSVNMNERLRFDMRLTMLDSLVVEVAKTYIISEHQEEKVVQYFSTAWCPLSEPVAVTSSLSRRDEDVFAKPHF